jgi:hypothetical protein
MILDGLTGQPIDQYVPEDYRENLSLQPGTWTSFDNSPYDTLLNNFYFDGANYYYYQTDSAAINFPTNSVFNYSELFPPLDELINNAQVEAGGTFGTGNYNFDQANGLVQGIINGGQPSVGLTNADLVNNGGLQDLPLGGFGSRFE